MNDLCSSPPPPLLLIFQRIMYFYCCQTKHVHCILVSADGLSDSTPEEWILANLTISEHVTLFVVQAVRGGKNIFHSISDISIDDFEVMEHECGCKMQSYPPPPLVLSVDAPIQTKTV